MNSEFGISVSPPAAYLKMTGRLSACPFQLVEKVQRKLGFF